VWEGTVNPTRLTIVNYLGETDPLEYFFACCIEGRAQGQCCLRSGRHCAGERELTNDGEVLESRLKKAKWCLKKDSEW